MLHYLYIKKDNIFPLKLIILKRACAIYVKKLLEFDWLRAVQFKCNTSANYTS